MSEPGEVSWQTPGKDVCRELDVRNLVNCTLMLSAFLVLTNRRAVCVGLGGRWEKAKRGRGM